MKNDSNNKLISANNLDVRFQTTRSHVHALKNIAFRIDRGESLGIVGESGSGKSVTSLSLLDLYRDSPQVSYKGQVIIRIDDQEVRVNDIDNKALQNIRGNHIGLVLQEPGSALNPVRKCGPQIIEALKRHSTQGDTDHKAVVLKTFEEVALSDIDRIYDSYPHELSGGQLQRVCIAMAIVGKPDLLICDEVTSALDVTIQKEIIDLLIRLRKDLGLTLLFISHDLDVVRELCDRIIIMSDGEIVEEGNVEEVFNNPTTTYTKELLNNKPSISPKLVKEYKHQEESKILEIKSLSHAYKSKSRSLFKAAKLDWVLNDVTFSLHRGEILGIVGESGSGKSTLAKSIVGIIDPTQGAINYINQNHQAEKMGSVPRRDIQLVFQDPYSSLNPSMSIGRGLYELLQFHRIVPKTDIKNRISSLLHQVGLSDNYYNRLPRELSGGQRQRICLAKALALEPKILLCDECVSALDVTVQSKILQLLLDLRRDLDLSILFISHDLAVINEICDRVLVMENGSIVESGSPYEIIHAPKNPYTQRLTASIPGR